MTQEEKQLLLKDLCARMSHGVICQFIWTYSNETTNGEDVIANKDDIIRCIDICTEEIQANYYREWVDLEHCKPYLRPMSSMTEKEKEEIEVFIFNKWYEEDSCKIDKEGWIEILANYDVSGIDPCFCSDYVDWLNEHHFDYHIVPSTGKTLIESGIALKAPKGMYKIE